MIISVMAMSDENTKLLRELSKKLDLLISIYKICNQSALDEFKKGLSRDKVFGRIIELADGSITYSILTKRVSDETGAAEITVKKKISDLKELGVLITRREGKEMYYDNSGVVG